MSNNSRRTNADNILRELISSRPGPFEAVVVSHMDPKYMGSLKVDILRKNSANSLPERVGTTIDVRYLSPFYGVTNYDHATPNEGYHNTQKSYGFWAVPPDPGTRVLVIFAENDISRGYWIGCIQDEYMNFMVPDGRASTVLTTDGTPDPLKNKKLPVGEYNKKVETGEARDPTLFKKPYNKDFTEILEVQGLLDDEVRGTTTSSARRDLPSAVYGWSTPGPIDKRQTAPRGEYGEENHRANVFVNRLGGSSIVMDDGDDKFIRATHAADGPPYYVNKEIGEPGGDETIPQNEGIRFRTRTGHQILLSNSEDLIYIGNSRGTAWIELTSDGKIDIFANDSISVYSEQDFNFTADRDINFDAGRNINMWASGRWSDKQTVFAPGGIRSGEVTIMGHSNTNIRGGENSSSLSLDNENINIKVRQEIKFETASDFHIKAGGDIILDSNSTLHITADNDLLMKSGNNIVSETQQYFNQVSNDLNVSVGANYRENIGANRDSTINGNNSTRIEATNNLIIAADSHTLISGSCFTDTRGSTHNITKGSSFTDIVGDQNVSVSGSSFTSISGDQNSLVSSSSFSEVLGDNNILVSGSSFITANGDSNIEGETVKITASSDTSIQGANINMDSIGGNINQNTGASVPADPAFPGSPVTAATPAQATVLSSESVIGLSGGSPRRTYGAFAPGKLGGYAVPRVIPGVVTEEPLQIITICTRVPQHEPWPHHENLDPVSFKPENLDRERMERQLDPADIIITPDTFLKGRSELLTSTASALQGPGVPAAPPGGYYGQNNVGSGPTGSSPSGSATEPTTPGTVGGVTVNPDGSINRGNRTGPNFQASVLRGAAPTGGDVSYLGGNLGRARSLFGSREDKSFTPRADAFGNSQGVVGGNINGRNYGTRQAPVNSKLVEILREAAAYSKVDVHVEVPGQVAYNDPNARTYEGGNRIGSRRHDLGFAVDMDLRDNGRNLDINNINDAAKMIKFVRAFRDFARQAGEQPAGAVGTNYMGSRMHLDIAQGNSVNHNAFSYHYRSSTTKAWIMAIMYGNRPDDGLMTPDGRIIGWDA